MESFFKIEKSKLKLECPFRILILGRNQNCLKCFSID